tara:strand:- start:1922 stop:2065 length:144 start_codon:yes stop_codon:yes gene_type:complete
VAALGRLLTLDKFFLSGGYGAVAAAHDQPSLTIRALCALLSKAQGIG